MATKQLIKKKPGVTSTQDDLKKAVQLEFVQWLAQKFNLKDENQLKAKAQELGEEGLKAEFAEFQKTKQEATTQEMRSGGMLSKLQKLRSLKKGGAQMNTNKVKIKTAEITIPKKEFIKKKK